MAPIKRRGRKQSTPSRALSRMSLPAVSCVISTNAWFHTKSQTSFSVSCINWPTILQPMTLHLPSIVNGGDDSDDSDDSDDRRPSMRRYKQQKRVDINTPQPHCRSSTNQPILPALEQQPLPCQPVKTQYLHRVQMPPAIVDRLRNFISRKKCDRYCISCHQTSTCMWREVAGLCLCNACGIRCRKYGKICAVCLYIPIHSESRTCGCKCGNAWHLLARS